MIGNVAASGSVVCVCVRPARPPLSWRIHNLPAYVRSLWVVLATWVGRRLGCAVAVGRLRLLHRRADGTVVDYGLVSARMVTTAWVDFVVDQLQTETSVFGDFKYHDSGTGVTAENITDTTMETVVTDNLRAIGTQTESAHNVYQTVGTIAYTGAHAITEHGLFNNTRAGGGTLMDRSVFAAVNVVNGDSVTATFSLTVSAGG